MLQAIGPNVRRTPLGDVRLGCKHGRSARVARAAVHEVQRIHRHRGEFDSGYAPSKALLRNGFNAGIGICRQDSCGSGDTGQHRSRTNSYSQVYL